MKHKHALSLTKRLFSYSLFFLLITTTPYIYGCSPSFSQSVESFDIKGIKLGMGVNEVRSAFPQIEYFYDKSSSFGRRWFDISKFTTQISLPNDASLFVDFTDKPYGSGAFEIRYKKILHDAVSPSAFLPGFKNDIIARYGKPKYEQELAQYYFACWGACNKSLMDIVREPWGLDSSIAAVKSGKISNGKYLIVYFDNYGLQYVHVLLFDTAPYFIAEEKKNEELTRRSKQKVNF